MTKMFESPLDESDKKYLSDTKKRIEMLKIKRAEIEEQIRDAERTISNIDQKVKFQTPYKEMRAIKAAILHIKRYGPMEETRLKRELLQRGACSNKKFPNRSIGQGIAIALDPQAQKGRRKPKPSLVRRPDGRIDIFNDVTEIS